MVRIIQARHDAAARDEEDGMPGSPKSQTVKIDPLVNLKARPLAGLTNIPAVKVGWSRQPNVKLVEINNALIVRRNLLRQLVGPAAG
jgi:hypothetical protein